MAKKFDAKVRNKDLSQDSKRLIKLRKSMGWSQRDLAKEFYVSPGAISLWESGRREISGAVLRLIEIYEQRKNLK